MQLEDGKNGVTTEGVTFESEGSACAATIYRRRGIETEVPGIVLAQGFANVRSMSLPAYAEIFAAAGMVAMTFDYRYLGDSSGHPRQQVRPRDQREDIRNALFALAEQSSVDASALGLWGTSFSAGHVLQVAALDRRVRAVVSQVPGLGLWPYLRGVDDSTARESLLRRLATDRERRRSTGQSRSLPIVAPEDVESVLGSRGLDWHQRAERDHPTFRNEILASSLDDIVDADPAAFSPFITPTPLLMIVAEHDRTAAPEPAYAAFEAARDPKTLLTYAGDHYDVYDVPSTLDFAASSARDFFLEHLN